ncbi:MAG: AAA family ATPase [bacterium]
MVTKLILENFTVFEKLELSEGINVIIGKNGTGKTHVLKALYSLLSTRKRNNKHQLEEMARKVSRTQDNKWKNNY